MFRWNIFRANNQEQKQFISFYAHVPKGQSRLDDYIGNGVQTTYSCDRPDRVSRILTRNSTVTLLDLNYAYDANGNLLNANTNE